MDTPRLFKLYEELEKGEKGLGHSSCSYGLVSTEDTEFVNWSGTIVGPPSTNFSDRIYMLEIECGHDYPTGPPKVKFNNKINLSCVNGSGIVDFHSMGAFNWSSAESMETALIGIFKEMQSSSNKSKPQPAEGEMY